MGITQHTMGTNNVHAVGNLAMLTGNLGKDAAGVNPLRGQNNVQGACDMGCLPDVFPGYQKVTNPEIRQKFAAAWGAELSDKPGLPASEMTEAMLAGRMKGMYIFGENPAVSDPNTNHAIKGFESLEVLVVQDIFLTETAALADVVLPSASFAEKSGTFTCSERRVHNRQLPPGEVRGIWPSSRLSTLTGWRCDGGGSAEEVLNEVTSLWPIAAWICLSR
jgi:predicted molibdopterin-dependent oxidoreductase YjgC